MLRYKEMRKLSILLGWRIAKQVAALTQQEWKQWAERNALLLRTESLEDGTLYIFTLRKVTIKVFVEDMCPTYQEITFCKGNLTIDLL